MEKYLAHIRTDRNGVDVAEQTVSELNRNTAQNAAESLRLVGLSASGYVAGLVHDAGKLTARYQDYLINGNGTRGSVNHTFSGVRMLLERYWRADNGDYQTIVCELLALAAGEHHGLFDCLDERGRNGFVHRLTKENIGYEEAVENFFHCCVSPEELDRRFQAALEELTPVLDRISTMTGDEADDERYGQETSFYLGLLSRLLLSGVIEGDRRDTAQFMNSVEYPRQLDREELGQLWGRHLKQMEDRLGCFSQTSPINRARKIISDQCRQAAEQPSGVFRLNVPTGGGKTLSGLRFALAHAYLYRKQRIIFTSPLLSILEQNAKVIREYIQDDSIILEHHSNIVDIEDDGQELDNRELLTGTWESRVIITTLVQLLNTLFSGKTTAIRRFHALCDSVIVIDEVQTVPSKMLSLFSLAVNFLAEVCGATIVLCSATQPCTEQIAHPIHGPVPDIFPYDAAVWEAFQRTDIRAAEEMSLEQIADFAVEKLHNANSLLIVCNKKSEAKQLYGMLKAENADVFSLSAGMCVAHRRETLDRLRASLQEKSRKTVCVSTQVIEAGVDISFACVIRLAAGMDSVVQAAGRCNRNGEAGSGVLAPVYLVQCKNESLQKLPDIQRGQDATRELTDEFRRHPESFRNRLDSDEAIGYYYRALYRREPKCHQDYCVKDGASLLSLLSLNERMEEEQPYTFRQAFRQAGAQFQVFESSTTDVIVPFGAGRELIGELNSSRAEFDPVYLKELLEKAKPYTVSLYRYEIDRLNQEHSLIPLQGGALGLDGHYSDETGFSPEGAEFEYLEV